MARIDITGQRFGRLVAKKRLETKSSPSGRKYSVWLCRCDCGKYIEARLNNLRQGSVSSCGCLSHEVHSKIAKRINLGEKSRKHGDANHNVPLYGIWSAMKRRCNNPNAQYYDIYGGRGITVCSDWQDYLPFKSWALSNGYKEGLTIDRIDCDGNYEPNNCRWITIQEQQRNRRNNKYYEYKGQLYTVREIAQMVGLKPRTIQGRIERGWTIEDVVETPCLKSNGMYYRKK